MQASFSTPITQMSDRALAPAQISIGPNAWAYRLAGLVLLGATSITAADAWLGNTAPSVISILINIWLAIGLLFLNKYARGVAIIRAIFGLLVWPVLLFFQTQ
jgi:hypothetical protein